MAFREFTDSTGVAWRVWNTQPTAGGVITIAMKQGWLTFECATSRRRFAPIPRDWEQVSDQHLEAMCRAAQDAPRVTPRSTKQVNEPDDSSPGI
jgi:hypothetical protein